ncbi:MAG: NAD(P)/FAD-dependent oxidoreductase [Pseudomonadota bacterium]
MADDGIFAAGFKETPYWWEAAPRPERAPRPLPAKVDVAIVGAGFTGLVAALTLARAGRSVAVLESQRLGEGASSRNAGYVGRTLKHSFGSLTESRGIEAALAIYREARAAYDFVYELVEREGISCHLARCGRFMAALSPHHYDGMAKELEIKYRHLGDAFEMVPRAGQSRETGSDLFHGGAMIPEMGSLHPGLYVNGLIAAAERAGAGLHDRAGVSAIRREGDGFTLETTRGVVTAREVAIATNGYTGKATPWLRRRVIPFNGFMVATEPLPKDLIDRVAPTNRTCHDWNNNLTYWRRAPDQDRLLLGWRTGSPTPDLEAKARRLHGRLVQLFPDLEGIRLSHVWTGQCSASFDLWPHIGSHDGMHYGLGYCFAGVPMGSWFGYKLAQRILRANDAATAFDAHPFQSRFYYRGWPWFRPLAVARFDWEDRRGL